jgi:RimJ/RimL family protein N-acetyltransferase
MKMVTGERVYLRLMEEKDIPYKVRWVNDPDVRRTLILSYPISEIGTKQWLHSIASDKTRRDFIVCLLENDFPIGFCGFVNIDTKNSKAEMYMAVGHKEYWGKGFAADISKVLMEYGFEELGMNRIYSYVWSENERMINLNKKFGYVTEGLLREDIFSHGEFRSSYMMSILKDEYLNNKEII